MASEGRAFDATSKEQQEIIDIYAKLRESEAKLIGPDGKTEILPNNLYSFLLRLLADLRAGNAVTILQSSHELTTIEASKLLGMSRQFLVQLLRKEKSPSTKLAPIAACTCATHSPTKPGATLPGGKLSTT